MRRMITEKDVEKLDSIKPSEIEKLGAMQDPKTATDGMVLTANGKGQALYKNASVSGSAIKKDYSYGDGCKLTTENEDKYGKHVEISYYRNNVITAKLASGRELLIGGVSVPLTAATVLVNQQTGIARIEICFSNEIVTKYSIAADTRIEVSTEIYYFE